MYHPEIPDQCPPHDAEDADRVIFRQVNDLPIRREHFLSHIENGRSNKRNNCEHWGCSIWVDEAGVNHARSIIPHFRSTYIISGQVVPGNGVIKHTPNNRQPLHHTFWKAAAADVTAAFAVFLEPELEDEEEAGA